MALAWHGKQIIIRNSHGVSDFSRHAKSDHPPSKKRARRKTHIYFHVHLDEGDGVESEEGSDGDGSAGSSEGEEGAFPVGFKFNKKYKGEIKPRTMFIDKILPANIRQDLRRSCKRMQWKTAKTPESAALWWCSDSRDKSLGRQNKLISKLHCAHKLTRVNFYCGTRYCLEKANLQSKLEMYSILLGADAFNFMPVSFILPRQWNELEARLRLAKGRRKRVFIPDKGLQDDEASDYDDNVDYYHDDDCRRKTRKGTRRRRRRPRGGEKPRGSRRRKNSAQRRASESSASSGSDAERSSGGEGTGGSEEYGSSGSSAGTGSSAGSGTGESEGSDGMASEYDSEGFPTISESDGETEVGTLETIPVLAPPPESGAAQPTGLPPTAANNDIVRGGVWAYVNDEDVYIVKPSAGKKGDGIALFQGWHGWSRLAKMKKYNGVLESCVVQKYIADPFLLTDRCKFDLRLYVCLESLVPMKAYLCTEGLARFATIPYEAVGSQNLHRRRMHLTNYSINRGSSFFAFSKSVLSPAHEENKGSKRTLTSVLASLRSMGRDTDAAMKKIRRLVARTCASMQAELIYIQQRAMEMPADQNKGFHLIGFDIMLDAALQPYLLEVNAHPSMRTDFAPTSDPAVLIPSPIDEFIKHKVVDGALQVLANATEKKRRKLRAKQQGPQKPEGGGDKPPAAGKGARASPGGGPLDEPGELYYYEKVKFDSTSMTMIRVGKQMLNLFGSLRNRSLSSDLDKQGFCRFFQMVALLKPKRAAGEEAKETATLPPEKGGGPVPRARPVSIPAGLTSVKLAQLFDQITLGKRPPGRRPTPGTTTKKRGGDSPRKDASPGKGDSLFREAFPSPAPMHAPPKPNAGLMAFPDFCRALFEIALLAAPKKGWSKLEAVQHLLTKIETRAKKAEDTVSRGTPGGARKKHKVRSHSMGHLFSIQQRVDEEKLRRRLEKEQLKRKAEARKRSMEKGKIAFRRVQREKKKKREEALAKEQAFLDMVESERAKQRRQSDASDWIRKMKSTKGPPAVDASDTPKLPTI